MHSIIKFLGIPALLSAAVLSSGALLKAQDIQGGAKGATRVPETRRAQGKPGGKKKKAPPKISSAPNRFRRTEVSRFDDAAATERTFWESVRDSHNPDDFKAYLKKYPNGEFIDLANNRLKSLRSASSPKPSALDAVVIVTPSSGNAGWSQAKYALYQQFVDATKTEPKVAHQTGKEYLSKYEGTDGADDQYVKYVKKWVAAYEKAERRNLFLREIANKNYNEAFAAGRRVLADSPGDLSVLYELSKAGLQAEAAGNSTNNAVAAKYAAQALKLIEEGKTFEVGKPVPSRDFIIASLNYALGIFARKDRPAESAAYFIKAARLENFSKRNPHVYGHLAAAYEKAEYTKLKGDYQANCKTEEDLQGARCVELTAKIDSVIDRIIDGLARYVFYARRSNEAAEYADDVKNVVESLTKYYKYRHDGSDAGLNEMIEGVTSRPIPAP